MTDEKKEETEHYGTLYFRPEGSLVNCYIEGMKDQGAPMHVASVSAHFFIIPPMQEGFISFCQFLVKTLLEGTHGGKAVFGEISPIGKAERPQ